MTVELLGLLIAIGLFIAGMYQGSRGRYDLAAYLVILGIWFRI